MLIASNVHLTVCNKKKQKADLFRSCPVSLSSFDFLYISKCSHFPLLVLGRENQFEYKHTLVLSEILLWQIINGDIQVANVAQNHYISQRMFKEYIGPFNEKKKRQKKILLI